MVVSRFLASLSQSRLRTPSPAPSLALLHRLLSSNAAGAAASSSTPFAAEDYLVSRCGLTQAQALKVAAKLSHFRSQPKPEAVLAFMDSALGIPAADIARVVVFEPRFLCADVESLARRVAELRDLGLSRDEIARLVSLAPNSFRSRSFRSNLEFWLAELGSFQKLQQVLRTSSCFLNSGIDTVARPNLSLLRQCGVDISQIVSNNIHSNQLMVLKPDLLKDAVKRVEDLGFKRGTSTFHRALTVVAYRDKEIIARKMQLLQNLGFSKAIDVLAMVRKQPVILGLSEQKIRKNVNFLIKDVGLEVSYIVPRPVLLMYSMEHRLLPRHCLLKALREKGLLKGERDFYTTASMSEKIFVEKFVHPFKNRVPDLTDEYASKCLGKATGGIRQPED